MTKSVMRQILCLVSMLVLCIGKVFSQSVVNFGTNLYSTKYYESMNAANPPAGEWYAVDYDDSGWEDYTDPLNYPEYDAFWVRRSFIITDDPANHEFRIQIAHDDEASFYINGHLIHSCGGCGRYNYYSIPNSYLVYGQNVLAANVIDYGGSQCLDCFISTTDGSDIIVDLPKQPMFFISNSSFCLYDVENYSEKAITAQMIAPTGVVDAQIAWTSSNPNVADVNDGLVTALSVGKTVVTATTTYNGVTYSKNCEVEVREIASGSKVVFVDEPGTLGSLLTAEEKDNVDNLTIFGKLDGNDIQVLRYMAGRNERGNRTPGVLADLDIYNVEFVYGTNSSIRVSNDYTGSIEIGKLPYGIFRNCTTLNSILLPKTVSRIGSYAFYECTNLQIVEIPNNITYIEYGAFERCNNLKTVKLPSSIGFIENNAFYECRKLESVSFEEGIKLTSISSWAFYHTNLRTITIPASVTSIGEYSFHYNENLNSVVFETGSQLVELKQSSFSDCYNLQNVELPEGCLEIGEGCFRSCSGLTNITIPASLISLGNEAFRYCNSLTTIEIPQNSKLTSIGLYAFDGTNVTSFYIPKGLTSISDIFSNTSRLQSLTVHPDNRYYESVGGIVYGKRDHSVVLVPKSIDGYLSFPDYVTTIPENLLQGCSKLKGLILHSGVTSFGENAFSGCSGLQTLMTLSTTPAAVSSESFNGIDKSSVILVVPQGSVNAYSAAEGWSDFENIVEASDVPTILLSTNDVTVYDVDYESARTSTVSVSVITKDGIAEVPVTWTTSDPSVATVLNGIIEFAGEGTTTVTASVTVGEYTTTASCNVTSVGMTEGKMVYVASAGTLSTLLTESEKENLTHLIVMGNLNSDDIRVLRYMAGRDENGNMTLGSLEVLDMGKARIVYGGEGYYYRDSWWRTVSDNTFNDEVFRSCNSLKKVILPSSLTGLGYYAFYECANLEEVVLPEGLTSIGHQAFCNCRKLSKVNIPSSVTNISSYVFASCSNLKSVDLSTMTGVKSIPDNMFSETGISSISIPANITNIGNYAFCNTPLRSIEFDSNSKLITISEGAFQSTRLQSIVIPSTVNTIGNSAFSNCNQLTTVTYAVDNKLTTLGSYVYDGCPIDTFFIPKRLINLGVQNFSGSSFDIVIEDGNKFFEIVEDVLYCKSDNSMIYAPTDKTIIYLPEYVTLLKNGVLRDHNSLKTIVLSSQISDLGDQPFCGDNSLTEVYCMNAVPPRVRYLSDNWYGDRKIYIPKGSKEAYIEAQWDSTLLEERVFDYGITLSTGNMKLYNVNGGNERELSAIVFTPAGPSKSGIEWTSSDPSIVSVSNTGKIRYINEGEAIITASARFADTVVSAECRINNMQLAASSDVYYVTAGNLSSLIPESRKYEISELILLGEINADDIRFIREMAGIDNNNNKTNGKLARLNLEAVNVVYGGSYWTCRWGTQYNDGNTLGAYVFADCSSLEEVILPSNLTSLSEGIFYECNSLRYVTLPSLINNIPSYTFYNCKLLTNVYIPEKVNYIGYHAFAYCTSLKSVISLCSVPSEMDWSAFIGLTKGNITLLIPSGTYKAYKNNNDWKEFRSITEMDQLPLIILGYNTLNLYNFNTIGAADRTIPATVVTKYGISDAVVTWSSSNPDAVTVKNGQVSMTTISGTSVITATAIVDGVTLTATCNVTTNVIDADNAYYVEAGNLPNLIPESQKDSIKKLVLFGELNGTDIRFIREMAGVPEYYWNNPEDGHLEYLDMSNATIVSGGREYGYMEYVYNDKGEWSSNWGYTENNVIGNGMFRRSSSLKTIILPRNIEKIGSYAFYECPKLEEVFNLPSTVTELSSRALYGFDVVYTSNLTPVELENNSLLSDGSVIVVPAASIDVYRTADNWKEFKTQIIPDNIQTTASFVVAAEDDNSGLLTAAGGDENLSYIMDLTLSGTINGYDIAIIRNRMPILRNLDLTNVKIVANPFEYYTDSHTEKNRLGRNAFRELDNLRRVVLPNSIDYIGDYAFYECENLLSVKMYEGLNTIDNYVFAYCHKLSDVEMPEGLLSIGYGAFQGCDRLEEITIPSTLLSLGGYAFNGCSSLRSIVLPKNLSRIEWETFWYCYNLESVVLPAKVNRIEYNAFYGCSKLKELRLPPMIESIGDRAFYDCGNIKDVYVYIANSKDIRIDMNTFSCWKTATLHIPSFSYNSYFWDTQWGQFYSKVEFSDLYDEFYTKNTLALNEATGTIQGDPDATLYEQGGLVVEDVEQVLDAVELKSDGTDGASLIASETGTIKVSKLTININVNEVQWHFFCFPFDIPLDSIHYDGEYVWRQYDGKARSRREGGWQNLAEGTTMLSKGRGYIFQGTVTGSLSFTIENPDLSAKDETTSLFTHESSNAQDANWNFIGNPYTSYYNIDETTYSAPITVWTGYGYEAYRPGDDDYQFAPYQAFFVQTPDDTESINFDSDGRESYEDVQAMKAIRRATSRAQANPDRLLVNLEITAEGDNSYTDKTRIVFNNKKSLDYELDCDAAKFINNLQPRSIELYSLDANGTMYSINERPVDDGVVKLGIWVNAAGTYSIDAVRMDTPVVLVDNELNVVHDLSTGSYTFQAHSSTNDRFSLHYGTITKVVEPKSAASKDEIYDLQGRKLNESEAKGVIIRNGKKVLGND